MFEKIILKNIILSNEVEDCERCASVSEVMDEGGRTKAGEKRTGERREMRRGQFEEREKRKICCFDG
jgi:hypothetical protein